MYSIRLVEIVNVEHTKIIHTGTHLVLGPMYGFYDVTVLYCLNEIPLHLILFIVSLYSEPDRDEELYTSMYKGMLYIFYLCVLTGTTHFRLVQVMNV